MDGIIVVNKPEGMTSRDVVNQVSQILHIKKIGHTGTLDPLATGVLVLCIGKATKLVELLTAYDKEYIATVLLGIKTDTGDITGTILEKRKVNVSSYQIKQALDHLIGSYLQTVPLYSAVKIHGKKLYEYARKKEEIILPKREVRIDHLEQIHDIKQIDHQIKFDIYCQVSKGTYIRSLIEDIAFELHTIGTMSALQRTKQGMFEIAMSSTLEQIKKNDFRLYSIEEVLGAYHHVEVDQRLYQKIKNGSLLKNIYNQDIIVFTYQKKVISIYKPYEKDKDLIKPWKMF